ncbi:MAG: Regulatory protein BlaR1 [Candidatus Hydrogenedentes bacterium]|nr:Regulatory protein BlaR1 [Candidatus Hydrogenedentota bacterium]
MRHVCRLFVIAIVSLAAGQASAEKLAIDKILDSPVSIEFRDIHLLDVTRFISDSWDINICLDWRVIGLPPKQTSDSPESKTVTLCGEFGPDYVTDGMVHTIQLKDIALRDALTALLRPLNLSFNVEPSSVWISSPAMIKADAKHPKPSTKKASKEMTALLASPVGLEFENIHLEEVLEFMSDSWDVNLVLDSRAVLPQGREDSTAPLGSPGYITAGVVPYIGIKDVAFGDALGLVLRSLNLTFKVEKNFIWVSSYELIDAQPLPAQGMGGKEK